MNAIINADFNGFNVSFRNDAYINATSIAKQYGKLAKDYLRNEQTKQYISALAQNLSKRRNILLKEIQLVIVKKGGNVAESGTWLHPKLAIDFARWLSPEFAVWCDEQIERILGVNLGGEKTTRDDRTGLRNAVNAIVSKKGMLYPDAYRLVHQRFNVEHIDELTLEQVGEATEYLHRLMFDGEKSESKSVALPNNWQPLIMCALTCAEAWESLSLVARKLDSNTASSMNQFFQTLVVSARTAANSIGFTPAEVQRPWINHRIKKCFIVLPEDCYGDYVLRVGSDNTELAPLPFKSA
ncbi:KilA-N domain-containing protein [Vitreoscilla massiliensis]|uniref:KilA-N domain-containing protein n=1 Tax=Vitreoscilla massiliensis TaxID=1689272 RepID=A0ABY4E292_9NEIS|nr:KilA-N domain-containing protein [Vitreoscilla massiliensis]UOO89495.1 KilA-N domain-containing protein [Vitreoscilla massiliensis]